VLVVHEGICSGSPPPEKPSLLQYFMTHFSPPDSSGHVAFLTSRFTFFHDSLIILRFCPTFLMCRVWASYQTTSVPSAVSRFRFFFEPSIFNGSLAPPPVVSCQRGTFRSIFHRRVPSCQIRNFVLYYRAPCFLPATSGNTKLAWTSLQRGSVSISHAQFPVLSTRRFRPTISSPMQLRTSLRTCPPSVAPPSHSVFPLGFPQADFLEGGLDWSTTPFKPWKSARDSILVRPRAVPETPHESASATFSTGGLFPLLKFSFSGR